MNDTRLRRINDTFETPDGIAVVVDVYRALDGHITITYRVNGLGFRSYVVE
jgi:hypothetical protein